MKRIFQRPALDFDYLLNPQNLDTIAKNVANRKQVGDINRLHSIWHELCAGLSKQPRSPSSINRAEHYESLWNALYDEALRLPNRCSPESPVGDERNNRIVKFLGNSVPKPHTFPARSAEDIGQKTGSLRTDLGFICGDKSYSFLGQYAQLERALVETIVDLLVSKGFTPITVPDILNASVPTSCGLMQRTEKNIVYSFEQRPTGTDDDDEVLSGTGEAGIAAYVREKVFDFDELPRRYVTTSRCFRPEVAKGRYAHGLYRVHEFTKVEMFAVTANETASESAAMLDEFRTIQEAIFGDMLGLNCRVLDMATQELGAPAYRKFDIEAWMPGRSALTGSTADASTSEFGEISSTSNCTDFQSRRLNVRYRRRGELHFAHTVNGTACAVPRTIIALLEQKQMSNILVQLPEALRYAFEGKAFLTHSTPTLKARLNRSKRTDL